MNVRFLAFAMCLSCGPSNADEPRVLNHQYIMDADAKDAGYLIDARNKDDGGILFVALPSPRHDWTIKLEKQRLQLFRSGEARGEHRYLCFRDRKPESDVERDKKKLAPLAFLAAEAKENSWWNLEIESTDGNSMDFYLRASAGDYKGWYLCAGEVVDNLRTSNSPNAGFKAKAVTLSPEKKPSCRLHNGKEGK